LVHGVWTLILCVAIVMVQGMKSEWRVVIKNTFIDVEAEDGDNDDADRKTLMKAQTESVGLRRLSSGQPGIDTEQEDEEDDVADGHQEALTVPAALQHQTLEATDTEADSGAISLEAEAEEPATSGAERRPSQLRLVVRNTFIEAVDEDEDQLPLVTRAKTDSTADRLGRAVESEDETESGSDLGRERRAAGIATELTVFSNASDDDRGSDLGCGASTESTRDRGLDPGCGAIREDTELFVVTDAPECDPGDACQVEHATFDNKESRTTLMLRNLPLDYTRDMLLHLLDKEGFAGKYDFLYLPVDFLTSAGLGYAFLNMVSATDADLLRTGLSGFNSWSVPSNKVCTVAWSAPLQGLQAHIDRYRNSAVMQRSVPEEFKPAIFKDGVQVAFPRPTKRLKKPDQWKPARSIRRP